MKGKIALATVVATVAVALAAGPSHASESDAWVYAKPPMKALFGWATGLDGPSGIAIDDSGRIYVANSSSDSITVYPGNWTEENSTPIKTLRGADTLLDDPIALAFDDDQNMYVVNRETVTVYPSNWKSGDTEPLKVLEGRSTQLLGPQGIAFDSIGRMYIANMYGLDAILRGSISVYASDWAPGDTAPIAVLQGDSTGIVQPKAIAFDEQGDMYVVNAYGVSVYAAGWESGQATPTRVLTGPGSGMDGPRNIAIDDAGAMYVVNLGRGRVGQPHVAVYDAGWSTGNVPPSGLIYGINSLLTAPFGIAIDDDGRLFITNRASHAVAEYQTQNLEVESQDSIPWTERSVTLTASSTSGLPVTITTTSPDVCTGSGTSPLTVVISSMGTCSYTMQQTGNDSWLPASSISDSFSVTAASQTITITQPQDAALAQKWVRVRATTSSGLPVTWTSSTPDVCAPKRGFGQRVNLVSAGTCTLTATQRGNKLWDSATASVSFEVTQ